MKKRRIALMTWHSTENYGTAFQAYALRRLIENAGASVDLVNYRRIGTSPLPQMSFARLLKGYSNALFSDRFKKNKQYYTFSPETFRPFWDKNFTYTQKCTFNQDFSLLNSLYDGFVCGSDQIWGPEWFDARFFLDFVKDNNRLISYAPSIGVPEITNTSVAREMASLIVRFPYLSVREETGCRIVKELTGRSDVVNALDPVLALPTDEWKKIQADIKRLPYKYAFIFFLKNNERNIKTSILEAEGMGYKPIILHCTQSEDTPFANTADLTPGQLLSYIQNAEYVCTDSFHMVALSIIYKKNFKVFKKDPSYSRNSKNNRISDLLKRLEINNAEYDVCPSFNEKIDYDKVYSLLNRLRQESYRYIDNAIDSLPLTQSTPVSERECELKARECGMCNGEQLVEFTRSCQDLKGLPRKGYNLMAKFPFSLEEKCYRCKYFKGRVKLSDNRMPLFWNDLKADLADRKSVISLFVKYYLSYSFSSMLHG